MKFIPFAFLLALACPAVAVFAQVSGNAAPPRLTLLATLATGRVREADFSADGHLVEVVANDVVQFWDPDAARLVRTEPAATRPVMPPTDGWIRRERPGDLFVLPLRKAPGEKTGRVVVWSRSARRTVAELTGFAQKIWWSTFSRADGGRRLLTISEPKKDGFFGDSTTSELIVWETSTGRIVSRTMFRGLDYFFEPTFSPNGARFLTRQRESSSAFKTSVWDAATGRPLYVLEIPPRRTADGRDIDVSRPMFPAARFTADGKLLIATTGDARWPTVADGNLIAFDAETGRVAWETADLSPAAERYSEINLSADESLLVAVREVDISLFKHEVTAEIREAATGRVLATLRNPDKAQREIVFKPIRGGEGGLVFSPSGATLITAGQSRAEVWDARTGRRRCGFPSVWTPADTFFGDPRRSDEFSFRAGQRLIAAQNNAYLRLWNSETCELVRKIDLADVETASAFWSPDERRLATIAKDGRSVMIWAVE